MENALVIYKDGAIVFDNYEQILADAEKLAAHVREVIVNEDTIKTSKKMLAEINKKVANLEDNRKAIKKVILKPYDEFEEQVKTIVKVVKDADEVVRSQVRAIEEYERFSKGNEIEALFERRMKLYPTLSMFNFDQFVKPQHMNKTTTMVKIETEMAEWFESRKYSTLMIKGLKDADDIMVEFVRTGNPVAAIQTVRDRNQKKEELTGKKSITRSVTITIDENDVAPVEAFMKSLKIQYNKN